MSKNKQQTHQENLVLHHNNRFKVKGEIFKLRDNAPISLVLVCRSSCLKELCQTFRAFWNPLVHHLEPQRWHQRHQHRSWISRRKQGSFLMMIQYLVFFGRQVMVVRMTCEFIQHDSATFKIGIPRVDGQDPFIMT